MPQKATIGAFVRIPIDENYHTYGRIIRDHVHAFYDLKTNLEISDLDVIEKSQVLFKLMIIEVPLQKETGRLLAQKNFQMILKCPYLFLYKK